MSAPTQRAPHRLRRRILIAVGALVVVLVVATSGVVILVLGTAHDFDSTRRTAPDSSIFPTPAGRPTAAADGAQNILLLGTDTRGPAPRSLAAIRDQRSDAMLLVHIPADRQRVFVISIMRDSWVDVPGHGRAKINAALSYGGVPLTVQVVERLTGVRIDHVAIVSFGGFVGLTDALGGVRVDNAKAFDNLGHHFARGNIRLGGTAALAYVRARYPFADGDYQRVRNQRAYLDGVVDSLVAGGPLDPFRARSAVQAIAPYVLTDPGLDAAYLGRLAVSLRSVRRADVVGFTMPTSGTGTESGQSVVYLDDDAVQDLAQHLQNDDLDGFDACATSLC